MMQVLTYQQLPRPMPKAANFFYPLNPSLEDEMKRLFANFTVEPVTSPKPNRKSYTYSIYLISRYYVNNKRFNVFRIVAHFYKCQFSARAQARLCTFSIDADFRTSVTLSKSPLMSSSTIFILSD